jgi:hypothetical protein
MVEKYQTEDVKLRRVHCSETSSIYTILLRKNNYLWSESDGKFINEAETTSGSWSAQISNPDVYDWTMSVEVTTDDGTRVWNSSVVVFFSFRFNRIDLVLPDDILIISFIIHIICT